MALNTTLPLPLTQQTSFCSSPSPHLSPSPLHSPSYSTAADSLAQLYFTGRKASHALGDYIMDRSHIECQERNSVASAGGQQQLNEE